MQESGTKREGDGGERHARKLRETSVLSAVYRCTVVRLPAARGAIAVLAACASGLLAGSVPAATPPGRLDRPSAAIENATNIRSLAVSADHRVVIAGINRQGVDGGHTFLKAFSSDLTQDMTFGGDGEVALAPDAGEPSGMVVEPDGQILLVRSGNTPTLYRLNRDGSRDESFGRGGSVAVPFDGNPVLSPSLALYPDGRILVAGRSFSGDTQPASHVHLRRYLPDGSPDPGFGTNGHVEQIAYDRGLSAAIALQPDGAIVLVVPSSEPGLRIARFTERGEEDLSFGRRGRLSGIALGRQAWEAKVRGGGPLVLGDGRIRIPITFGDFDSNSVTRMGVIGLTARGRVDRKYGRRGLALGPRIPVPEGGEGAGAAVPDARGYILVAGSVAHGDDLSGSDATVVRRFRPSGALDRSFGRRGVLRVGPSGDLEQLLAMLDRDTAVLAVESGIGKYNQWNGGRIRTFSAGYDREDPAVTLTSGCRWMRIRIRDTSPLDRLVLRIDRRVVRQTTRKRLRIRVHPRERVSVTAVDAAGNPARVRTTVPRC
jgi:uncharacterized delta-60 repeat protein